MQKARQKGFTLIELSIVLVIIGLIVGGVLVGQDLIHAAEVRALITDKDKIATAIYTFEGKYNYLPGDFPNADSMLGDGTACSGGCPGDGNGSIDDSCSSVPKPVPYNSWPYTAENVLMWAHLSKAGMIWGNYGYFGAGLGTQYPASNYGHNVGYIFQNDSPSCIFNKTWTYGQTWTNYIYLTGGVIAGAGNIAPGLTPQDAYSIDKKIDDGLPASGNIQVLGPASGVWWSPSVVPSYACATTQTPSTSVYDMTVNTRTCLMFWFGVIPQ